jgi:AcrR family transcriptional regulator
MPETPLQEDTRERILRVALRLFTEKGFAATTTRELSEELGFTKAALYYHFRTKDDLLEALVLPAFDNLRELIDSAPARPSLAQRRALLAGYVELVASSADLVQAFASDPSMARRPILRTRWTMFQELTTLLSGQAKPSTATRTKVRFALGGVDAALRRLDSRDDLDVVRAATLAAACGALGID